MTTPNSYLEEKKKNTLLSRLRSNWTILILPFLLLCLAINHEIEKKKMRSVQTITITQTNTGSNRSSKIITSNLNGTNVIMTGSYTVVNGDTTWMGDGNVTTTQIISGKKSRKVLITNDFIAVDGDTIR
jgi:hypothetical protein